MLIGTRTVEKSERLSKMLHSVGIDHEVLNARQDARENEIIARTPGSRPAR